MQQHLGGDSFDCCTERYEIVVYYTTKRHETTVYDPRVTFQKSFSGVQELYRNYDHAREPLYSNSTVIALWLQSTSVQNSVPSC